MFFALPPYPMILASSYERIFSLDDAYRAVHTPLFGRARPQLPSSTPPFPCDFWHSLGWARVRTPDHPDSDNQSPRASPRQGEGCGTGGVPLYSEQHHSQNSPCVGGAEFTTRQCSAARPNSQCRHHDKAPGERWFASESANPTPAYTLSSVLLRTTR